MNGETERLQRELYKIKREIDIHGKMHTFYRDVLNDDGEPTGEIKQIVCTCGLLHVSGGYVARETSAGTETRTKREPMLLLRWEEVEEVQNRDFVILNNYRYNVINKRNVNEYNIVADLSLEVVLNGYN